MAGLGHIAVGVAAARLYNSNSPLRPTRNQLARAMIGFVALSVAPDLDVWAFRLGIPYHAPFGHRGASHSIAVAIAVGIFVALMHVPRTGLPRSRFSMAVLAGMVILSHGLLDTLTYGGGQGVALLWPISSERLWSPVRVIPVSPIGFRIFSIYGLRTIATELALFSPLLLYAFWPRKKDG